MIMRAGSYGSGPVADQGVDEGHDELRGATTQITPPGRKAIGRTHNLAVEHRAHPKLARHESGQREPDEEAHDDEAGGVGNQRHRVDARRDDHDEKRAAVSRPHYVAHRAHQKSRQNRTCHAHKSVESVY